MRTTLLPILCIIFITACRKTESNPVPPTPPIVLDDSIIQITSTIRADVNDEHINYAIKPPQGKKFENILLYWSETSNFAIRDSTLLSPEVWYTNLTGQFTVKRLKQMTKYYVRIGLTYQGKAFNSATKEFITDTLKILGYKRVMSRGIYMDSFYTNFAYSNNYNDTSTRVWLGNYSCTMQITAGNENAFLIPSDIPSNTYALKFERNGISTIAPDSVLVPKGYWSDLTPPVIPLQPGYPDNAIAYFATCYTDQKGYILPGSYYRDLPYGHPEFGRPGYILEFDIASQTWRRLTPAVQRQFEYPIVKYFNNALYVLGGQRFDANHNNLGRVQKMMKLDLTTLVWTDLDPLPYPAMINLVHFDINNEWYIGLGADAVNLSQCCGYPTPNNKFWKYNPATNTWTTLADLPRNHGNLNQPFPTGFSVGNKGYVFYGAIPVGDPHGINFRQEFWQYNPSSNTWSQLSIPQHGPPIGEKYCIVDLDDKAYFLTMQRKQFFSYYYGSQLYDVYMQYNPATNSYSRISSKLNSSLMKPIGKSGNKIFFQEDAIGYISWIHNKTFELRLE